jgi:RNA polymerase sigma factor (TIGR02999 family)
MSDSTLGNELRARSERDYALFVGLQQELRRIARRKMRWERAGHTLQPTALVHEVFIKVLKKPLPDDFWINPRHAIRYLTRAMEQILNDHADAYNAAKRGGATKIRVPLDDAQAGEFAQSEFAGRLDSTLVVGAECEKIIAIRSALRLLRQISPREARVVELLFYGGLSQEEAGAVLGISAETVKLDWRKAKAFLKIHISPGA